MVMHVMCWWKIVKYSCLPSGRGWRAGGGGTG